MLHSISVYYSFYICNAHIYSKYCCSQAYYYPLIYNFSISYEADSNFLDVPPVRACAPEQSVYLSAWLRALSSCLHSAALVLPAHLDPSSTPSFASLLPFLSAPSSFFLLSPLFVSAAPPTTLRRRRTQPWPAPSHFN